MFNKTSRETPYYCSKETLELENIKKNTNMKSAATITQKADRIARETLIKVCGTNDHWISRQDLGLQSEVFKRMFSRNWKESTTYELKIESEETENKKRIDQFIQCLETRKSQCMNAENFQELLSLAYKYEVSWLVKDCEQFIALNLTLENVLSVIRDIAGPYSLPKLLRNCFIFLCKNKASLSEAFMNEMQILGEKLRLVELKIIASQALKAHVSFSKNPPCLFNLTLNGDAFERSIDLLIQIFSEESFNNKPSINLKLSNPNISTLAQFLKSNPKVSSFYLGDPQEMRSTWKDNYLMVSLDLGVGQLEYAGIAPLAAGLKENKTLTNICLRGNVKPEDAIQIAVAILKENKALISLDLQYNRIGDVGVTEIIRALKENKTLRSLSLEGNELFLEDAMEIAVALKESKTLVSLNLQDNFIGGAGAIEIAAALKENKTLTTLDLAGNNIGDEGSFHIAAALKENKTLVSLDLQYNSIEFAGAAEIAAALKENKTLVSLDLQENLIECKGAIQIAVALKENKTLTDLDLSSNKIGDEGASEIAAALKENKMLTTLSLRGNKIGTEGAIQIAKVLKENKTLTDIDLENNEIGNEGIIQIAVALKENTTLTSLDLGMTGIGDEGAIQIAEALKENKTLIRLTLQYNRIGDAGAAEIAAALKENTTLTSLDLQENDLITHISQKNDLMV